MPLRRLAVLLLAATTLFASGCGSEDVDVDRVRTQAEERVEEVRRDIRERRERIRDRVEKFIGRLEKAFPRPTRTSPVVRSRGRNEPQTIDAFLTDLLQNIDRYWTRTMRQANLEAPRVGYEWIPPGDVTLTGCGPSADDNAAFYCPRDDTIYVAQQFAADLYNGVARNLPGDGRAAGDFAVAYVLAHEYAHNIQQELGIFNNRVSAQAKPFELQADCLAGAWAYSVFQAGELEPGDLDEALSTARAVGDFDRGNEQHHGTPDERQSALRLGYEDGAPNACERYVPQV